MTTTAQDAASRMSQEQLGASLVVAVLTYKRPDDLAQVLPQLIAQSVESQRTGRVMVIDNDPDGSAERLVARFPGARYVHEPRPGIAAARNRALAEAGNASLLVFIDDDERPSPGWLGNLLAVYDERRPAAVVGPVVSTFETSPDLWVSEGRVFDRRALETGTPVTVAATNNLLLDLEQVRELGLSFDERFGITGGSDTLFTVQLSARGGQMLWCQEAVVTDVVPQKRATRGWVLRRAYRSGNAWSRVQLLVAGPAATRIRTRVILAVQGGARLVGGALRWLGAVLTGRVGARARAERTIMRGAGMLTGLVGLVYAEYRRPS